MPPGLTINEMKHQQVRRFYAQKVNFHRIDGPNK
jgi:hypothetical protein